jgi:hypothetical protein
MSNKIWLYVFVLLVLCSTAYAVNFPEDVVLYFSHNDANVSGANETNWYSIGNDAIITGATSIAGVLNEARNYDGTGDYSKIPQYNEMYSDIGTGDFTWCLWADFDKVDANDVLLTNRWGAGDKFTTLYMATAQVIRFRMHSEACGVGADKSVFAKIGDNQTYYHICAAKNGNNLTLYVNGTLANTSDQTAAVNTIGCDLSGMMIGAQDSGAVAAEITAKIDEIIVFNGSVSEEEAGWLWNDSNGCNPYINENNCGWGTPSTTDLNINALDDYTRSAVNNFSASVTWSNNGSTNNYSTTTGSISITDIGDSSITVNVTIFNATDYFNLTLTNQAVTANTTNTINAYIYQAYACFNATETISGNTVTADNYTIGTNVSTSCFNITAGSHNVMAQKEGWYDQNQTVTITALTNTTTTITDMHTGRVNITAYYPNSTILMTWGVNITSQNETIWGGVRVETSNGSVFFNAINGTYTGVINSTEGNETFTFTVDQRSENITFLYFDMDNCTTYTQQTLNFTIYNEDTGALFTNATMDAFFNVTSDFYIGSKEFNFSFSLGNNYTICVPNNTVANWTADAQITYSDLPTYTEKNYYLVNYSLSTIGTDIMLYLTNGTTQVTFRVRDYNDDPIPDVYIKVLSYDVGTNSYTTTEVVKSDTDGDAYAQIILNTEWYAFILEYQGEVVLQTLPTKITSTTRTFRINLATDYFDNYDISRGITHSLFYTNSTTTFSFTWSDPTGSVQQGCLRLRKQSINGETTLNTTCLTSTGANILMVIPGSVGTNTFIADSYAIIAGQEFALNSTSVSFNLTHRTFGASGLFLSLLIILVLVMAGIWHPVVAVVLMVVGVIATNVMGLFYLNTTYIITLVILAGITIYRTGKSD